MQESKNDRPSIGSMMIQDPQGFLVGVSEGKGTRNLKRIGFGKENIGLPD